MGHGSRHFGTSDDVGRGCARLGDRLVCVPAAERLRRREREIDAVEPGGEEPLVALEVERETGVVRPLAPLDSPLVMELTQEQPRHDPAAGFGANGKPDFWIGGEGGLDKPLHVAIVAKDRATVDAFHKAAMAAGGRDNGAPGIRAHYHPNYYGAFVLDPDGHNIEAVCHAPA